MKRLLQMLIIFIKLASITPTWGQLQQTVENSFSIGVSAGRLGYDPAVGLELCTPAYCNNRIHFRIKGNITWLEAYKATYNVWATYKTIGAAFVYNFHPLDKARPYAELGATFILPADTFSDSHAVGINAAAGLELFVVARPGVNICYYFCGGGIYSQAYAEKIENKPRYANGFVFNNGFRVYF